MEAIGMVIIVLVAFLLTQTEGGMIGALPTLGAIALGGQKLLPASQQVYSTYSTIKGTKKSLDDVVMLLEQPLPKNINTISPLSVAFNNGIKLENLSFRYTQDSAWVLKNINLSIAKGSRIGFMGETGSGKSTLIDIIMGLIRPSNGKLLIDDELINFENSRAWQSHIAHVPQNIYLSDTSISENIAFGVPRDEVNIKQVEEAAKKAKLDDLIGSWKDGYEAIIGERGVKLSGGQRQRIGIARALYKQADLLVFDEATNALDSNTEREVMSAINNLNKDLTILIIAHRLTTLKQCDLIISIGSGGELNVGSYKEMVGAEYK
jgi:ATP-binding cassette subfamily B protein